jgi:hypothetical protein
MMGTEDARNMLSSVSQPPGRGPGIGPWHQSYRAARIYHFIFLSIFHEYVFYSGNILRTIIFVNVSKSADPEGLNNVCVAYVSDQAACF